MFKVYNYQNYTHLKHQYPFLFKHLICHYMGYLYYLLLFLPELISTPGTYLWLNSAKSLLISAQYKNCLTGESLCCLQSTFTYYLNLSRCSLLEWLPPGPNPRSGSQFQQQCIPIQLCKGVAWFLYLNKIMIQQQRLLKWC